MGEERKPRTGRSGALPLLFGAMVISASAALAGPLTLAVLPEPGGEGEGLVLPFLRTLDASGLPYIVPSFPEGLEENLAEAVLSLRDGGDRDAAHFLMIEAEEHDLDGILLLGRRTEGGGERVEITAVLPPFRRSWSVRAPLPLPGAYAAPLGSLADSAAVRLGGVPAASREEFPVDLEAEALFARALRFGSLPLGAAVLERVEDHDAARSWLGFRLFLRESREKGREMRARVRAENLGPFERRVHETGEAILGARWEEADEGLSDLRARYPDRYETLILRGLRESSREDRERARGLFGEAVHRRPLDPLPHRLLAEAALRDGYLDLAREEYRRVLDLLPHDTPGTIGLASVSYSEGLLEEAAELLALPPPSDPHGVEGTRPLFLHLAARAGLSFAEGRFGEARAILREGRDGAFRALDEESLLDLTARLVYVFLEDGETDSAWTELAELRYRAGKRPAAAPGFPGFPVYLEGLHGAYRQDRGTVAAKRLELETIPGAPLLGSELIDGSYYLLQGEGWEATPPLRRALRQGDDRLVRHLLGRASVSAGRTGPAIQDLEWVVERGESLLDLPPVLPLSFYYLGRALEERGDNERAKLAYREFLHYWKFAAPHRPERIRARLVVHGSGGGAVGSDG